MKDLWIIIVIIIVIGIVIFYFINKAINYFENKNSVLLDADVNKLIAENNNRIEESLEKALKPIIKQVNKAALKGRTFYIVDNSYHYRYKDKFSREEIESFFKKYGYKVVFVYSMINDSSIGKITWQN